MRQECFKKLGRRSSGLPSRDSGRPVTWVEGGAAKEYLRRSDALVRDQHESPMVAAGRRARPVRMKGGRRCPPASRRFLPTMFRAFHESIWRSRVFASLLQTRRRIICPAPLYRGWPEFLEDFCGVYRLGMPKPCRLPYIAASRGRPDGVAVREPSPTASQPGSICQRLRPDMLAPTAIIRRTLPIGQEFLLRVRLNYVRCPFPA